MTQESLTEEVDTGLSQDRPITKEHSETSYGSGMSGKLLSEEPEDDLQLLEEHQLLKRISKGEEENTSRRSRTKVRRSKRRPRGSSLERQIREVLQTMADDASLEEQREEEEITSFSIDMILQDLSLADVNQTTQVEEKNHQERIDPPEDDTIVSDEEQQDQEPERNPYQQRSTLESTDRESNLEAHRDPPLDLNITDDDEEHSWDDDELREELADYEKTPVVVVSHISFPAKQGEDSPNMYTQSVDRSHQEGEHVPEETRDASPLASSYRRLPPPPSPASQSKKALRQNEKAIFKTNFDDWSSKFDDTLDPSEFGQSDFFSKSGFDWVISKKAERLSSPYLNSAPRVQLKNSTSWMKDTSSHSEKAKPMVIPTNSNTNASPSRSHVRRMTHSLKYRTRYHQVDDS